MTNAIATRTAYYVLQDLIDSVADLLAAYTGHDRIDYESSQEASESTYRSDAVYRVTAETVGEDAERIARDVVPSLAEGIAVAKAEADAEAEWARENGRVHTVEDVVAMLLIDTVDDIDLDEPVTADGIRVYVSAWA